MFEEEQDNKIYNLIITQGILWTETVARDYSAFSEKFFEKVDLIVILSGLYNENKEMIEDLIQVSENFDIPILLVRPYGMEIVPEDIEEKAKAVIGWNANCIIDTIKDIVNGTYDEEDDFI